MSLNVNAILSEEITKLNHNLMPPNFSGSSHYLRLVRGQVADIIDRLGRHSAAAQGLTKVITTTEKVIQNESFIIYIIKDDHANNGNGEAIGMLKIGRKNLYLNDPAAKLHEIEPWCILDFFIEPSYQRHGLGKKLVDYMLQDINTPIKFFAIDGPSQSMLRFLAKNYGLNNIIIQANNFALADDFFDHLDEIRAACGNVTPSVPSTRAGRFTAAPPRSAIATVIHGGSPAMVDSRAKVPLTINEILPDDIMKFDHHVTPPFVHASTYHTLRGFREQVADVIDRLARHSAAAQGVSRAILTTSEKLKRNESFVIYIMKHSDANDGNGEAIGMLKIGRQDLYLNDTVAKLHQIELWCILDFFIEPSYQRQGFGKKLMDHMLEDLKIPIKEFAFAGQSQSFFRFLAKNYSFENIIVQPYSFCMSDEFVEHKEEVRAASSSNVTSSVSVPRASQFTASQPSSEMAKVVHGGRPVSEASRSSSRRASQLTDKGYFDVKFYHNKLW